MAGHNALAKQFKQFNGSPPARTRGRPDDRERSVKLFAEVQKIYRECSPAAAKEMCRLAVEAEDERVRSVCLSPRPTPLPPTLQRLPIDQIQQRYKRHRQTRLYPNASSTGHPPPAW